MVPQAHAAVQTKCSGTEMSTSHIPGVIASNGRVAGDNGGEGKVVECSGGSSVGWW